MILYYYLYRFTRFRKSQIIPINNSRPRVWFSIDVLERDDLFPGAYVRNLVLRVSIFEISIVVNLRSWLWIVLLVLVAFSFIFVDSIDHILHDCYTVISPSKKLQKFRSQRSCLSITQYSLYFVICQFFERWKIAFVG